jgi:hypothetical protein
MKEYEERTPTTSGGAVTQTTEAAMHWEQTDLLLSQLRAYLRMRRVSEGPNPEQRTALADVEVALDAYVSWYVGAWLVSSHASCEIPWRISAYR